MTLVGEDDGKGGVRVTNAAIYNAVVVLISKVDELVDRDNNAEAVHADFETRLRRVEQVMFKALGAVALVTFVLSIAGYYILTHVHR